MKKLALLAAFLLLVSACEEEESNPTNSGGLAGASEKVKGEAGSNIEVTLPSGSKETMESDRVTGWHTGAWMDQDYFNLLRIYLEEHTLNFRLSVPGGTPFKDVAEDKFVLKTPFLILRNTGDLEEVYPELYFSSSDDYAENESFAGTVEIFRNASVGGKEYDVVGKIDADFSGRTFNGYFWLEEADW